MTSEFKYSMEIANECLLYISLCTIALIIGYKYKRKPKLSTLIYSLYNKDNYKIRNARFLFRLTCFFQICIALYIIVQGHANYHLMTKIREGLNFLFELRIFPLILATYLIQFITKRNYKHFKLEINLFIILVVLFILIQARSLLLELGCIIGYYFLKAKKNRIKFSYIIFLYVLSIIPNLVVLGRLPSNMVDLSDWETWKNIFTYEYTIIFNSILGETIGYTKQFLYGETIFENLSLLIPSFIRNFLDIHKDVSSINEIAKNAEVFGGGFSLFAEMFLNFGWVSVIGFYFLGYFLAYQDNIWFNKNRISVFACTIPIVYSYFVLGLRNDMGVLVKQLVQIYVVAYIIKIFLLQKSYCHESIAR